MSHAAQRLYIKPATASARRRRSEKLLSGLGCYQLQKGEHN